MITGVSSRTIWRGRGPLYNDWIVVYSVHDGSSLSFNVHTDLFSEGAWGFELPRQTVYNKPSVSNMMSCPQTVFVK